ncbi:long-chain-fatty-acid--CoA ligase [Weizmannia sp. CD-2023]|uniref:long-chain-fatty-acid--CoA ligase n=1 Tax=Heyndrickxia TaxID=2837504 RepID=UPI0005525B09|nr:MULTISPECIES: long-chain-fatty-acid--CoA ligase [Heyndrickxia]KGT37504.1 AMP-dependent synthetase [Heyndrickxia coagulans P38]MED4319878.1 long-chain-fatty-acid--CoA ligase [Weizmannia sp. CD-2023]MED4840164.1 long-chain-fatty-acid--CoA ligase [Weizmannia sp. CD-2023]MED4901136.1 long-chain-fatty-acid--CoA ligase [Weizmannia sp. CD-2023]MED4975316.1 long-chain-fatty-acid--CoA ligase [Weizmannia sp. CD-2023]
MNVPLVLTEFLDRAVLLYGGKTAVYCGDRAFTYRELNGRVNRLSYGLKNLGIEKGDRVAYLAPNTVEMLEGFYGIFQLGAVMVPLNIRLTPEDYRFILNHSGSKVLFVDQEMYHLIEPVKDELETVEQIIIHYKEDDCAEIDYDRWLDRFPPDPFPRAGLDENNVCSLLYTSGTTGNPKGVMLTHRNNYLHALSAMHHLRVTDRDVYLHVLPMFHVNGWGSPFYYTANGATHVCLRKPSAEAIFTEIIRHNVTVVHMAPTVLNSLLQYNAEHHPAIEQDVRVVIAGAAPPPAFVERVEKELGWEFIQVYGMTESTPLTLVSVIRSQLGGLDRDTQLRLRAKAGFPMIGSDVRVLRENDEEVAHDGKEIGEVTVRGHGVMLGYWKNPEETMKTIRNGRLYTGDMATVDEYGYIDIVDRKKDIIISGGENISSIEVEGVLYEHPAVLEAAVIAVPHEKWGETPHAFVVRKADAAATEEDIIRFSRERLAHFKAVTGVTFVDELPKTASGKIQKVRLRNEYWEKLGKTERFVN